MRNLRWLLLLAFAVVAARSIAQYQPPLPNGGLPTKSTFIPLGPISNAVLVEPVTPNEKSRIAVLITHPEHLNNFSYFTGWELPRYGYRAMMLNYYGREQTYYEFIEPIAAAIKTLRAIPGVEKVVLVGHSTGGAELTSYEDVAENGAAACQEPDRVYKCDGKGLDNLPRADGIVGFEVNVGAPEKTMAIDPAPPRLARATERESRPARQRSRLHAGRRAGADRPRLRRWPRHHVLRARPGRRGRLHRRPPPPPTTARSGRRANPARGGAACGR